MHTPSPLTLGQDLLHNVVGDMHEDDPRVEDLQLLRDYLTKLEVFYFGKGIKW